MFGIKYYSAVCVDLYHLYKKIPFGLFILHLKKGVDVDEKITRLLFIISLLVYFLPFICRNLIVAYFPLLLFGFNHRVACFSVSSCCPPFCPSTHLFILDPARRGAALHNPPPPCRPRENGSSGGRDEEFHQSDTFKNHLPSKPPMPGVRKWAAWGRPRRTPPPGTHFVALRGFSQELGRLFSPPSASAQRGFRCSQHRRVRMWTDQRESQTVLNHFDPPSWYPPPTPGILLFFSVRHLELCFLPSP